MNASPNTAGRLGLEDLVPWIEEACGGKVVSSRLASGGNRCWGWLIDVEAADGRTLPRFLRYQAFEDGSGGPYTTRREAELYAALRGTGVRLPHFVAVHPVHQAMLTERASGSAEYRGLKSDAERATIAQDFVTALAALHRVDAAALHLPSFGRYRTVTEAVAAELDIWRTMYRETGREDPLIEFGHAWLAANNPVVERPPSLVHGDAGPGNIMFEQGRMTGIIDWELAHLGDPMEDLAWLSFRSVMAPVPDLARRLREYAAAEPEPLALDRIRYHRVFVSWRIVIIRHCNASGDVGPSIISRALNRRLIVEALADVLHAPEEPYEPMVATPRPTTEIYDRVLANLRDTIVPNSADSRVIVKAKDCAKAIKFLRQVDIFGDEVQRRELADLAETLGHPPASLASGRAELARQLREGRLGTMPALRFFRRAAAIETQLAADTLGSLASRHFDALTD